MSWANGVSNYHWYELVIRGVIDTPGFLYHHISALEAAFGAAAPVFGNELGKKHQDNWMRENNYDQSYDCVKKHAKQESSWVFQKHHAALAFGIGQTIAHFTNPVAMAVWFAATVGGELWFRASGVKNRTLSHDYCLPSPP